MNNLYTYNLMERYNSFCLYIIKEDRVIETLDTFTENQYKAIKNILFLKNIKLIKHYETSIPIELFNLIKPYLEDTWY